MGEAQRWTVTYTKHVKQKRKVYQDGSLHLLPNNKVMLYDECEQLLDSKFLTKDEPVKLGESLTFASFLVEIGDPDNNVNLISNQNSKSECDNKPQKKTQMPQGEKSRHTFPSWKPNIAGRKTSSVCLSPSQKIIREFKKNEVLKYSARSPTSPTALSFREWKALYTTQLTQKAKKYHDGFLRLTIHGSLGRQIILYDSSKNQIDKRFLKKDEVISSGESLAFDAHLVDIGDPTETNGEDADMNIQGRNCNANVKSEMLAGGVLQKSFSDNSGSHAKRSKKSAQMYHLNSGKNVVKEQPRDVSSSSKCNNSGAGSFGFDKIEQKKLDSDLSLRDASQILSIMRKPVAQDNIAIIKYAPVHQCPSSTSELVEQHDDSQEFNSSQQVDRHQVIKVVDNYKKAANGGHCSAFSEGNCSKVEMPDSMQGNEILTNSVFESLHNSSVDNGKPAVLQPSKGASFIDSHSSVGSETTNHHQPSTKLPRTDPESNEESASNIHMSKWFGNLVGTKMKKSVKTDKSEITLDFPSFDLGI